MNYICDKCKTCGKFPFCNVEESKDGNCGDYIKSLGRTITYCKGENENE